MMTNDPRHRIDSQGRPAFKSKVLDIRQRLRKEMDSPDSHGPSDDAKAQIIPVGHIIKQRGIEKAVKELRDRTGLNEEAARDVVEQLENKKIVQRSQTHNRTSRKSFWYSMIVLALINLVKVN